MKAHRKKANIKTLSPHLFWDTDSEQLTFEKNRKLIIHRVLDYGLLDDWNYIEEYYGCRLIAKTATTIKDLDKKSMAFMSLLSGIPKEHFACYTTKQSTTKHWIY